MTVSMDISKSPSPADLRQVFGANLRKLAQAHDSIAGLCRELQINRTQFNRYLSGESFPRPDILHRIATFFGCDARILLEPVDEIDHTSQDLLHHPVLNEFFGQQITNVPEPLFPNGFYRFSRPSFVEPNQYLQALVMVWRTDGFCFVRGLEAKAAFQQQGLPWDVKSREYRGTVMMQEEGITMLSSRRNATTCSFGFLNKVPSFQNNFWVGFATRTVPEGIDGSRAVRMVFEHLDHDTGLVLNAARSVGFCTEDDLPHFHKRLLRTTEPFK